MPQECRSRISKKIAPHRFYKHKQLLPVFDLESEVRSKLEANLPKSQLTEHQLHEK